MAMRYTQPVARQQINVAPVASVAPAVTTFTATQWHQIDAAVAKSLTGIQAGNTVGGFAALFQADLLANPGTNPDGSNYTGATAANLAAAYQTAAGGGAGFRDQGNSAAPFYAAWDARLHTMFGATADPVPIAAPVAAPPRPVVIAPPPALIAPTPVAAPVPIAQIAATVPLPAPLPPDPVTSQTIAAAIVAALTPSAAAAATATTSSALQTTTDGTAATTATASTTDATTAALIAALGGANALAGSSQGLTSPASVVGTPSTGGIQAITPVAAPSTTSSNPALVAVAAVVALVAGGFVVFRMLKHKKGGAPSSAGGVTEVTAPRPIDSVTK